MDKKISYEARDYAAIKAELIKFSNQYYPELADTYNDSSVGSWFIDLCATVGDSLNYSLDRALQETNINSASMRSTVNNIARMNGLKIPGAKAAMCEVELSCVIPVLTNSNGSIAQPNWDYAPIVKRGTTFSSGAHMYEIAPSEGDVNFAEQFNNNGYSNRTIVPSRDTNGNITGYTVTKSIIVNNGQSKIYSKVITTSDVKPFMEIILPEVNVLNVESIIFKETSNYGATPSMAEFFIDAEEYRVSKESTMTYRYFEVDSLADQYRFGTKVNLGESANIVQDWLNPEVYDDYTEGSDTTSKRTTRYYKGRWIPLRQKYVTEFTDNGFMKITFGAGNGYPELPDGNSTIYGEYMASNLINNDMLGLIPNEGWTMFILYRIGGGYSTNLGLGAINTIVTSNIEFSSSAANGLIKGDVVKSLSVTNISTGVAGKDAPSVEEIKNLIKYNNGSMGRCVTVKDYKSRVMMMPPRFGAPFRAQVIEANNKIEMSFLGLNAKGQLDSALPQTLVENVIEYMSNYKTIGDYIEIKSGRIYNLGVLCELFIDKNYNASDVVANVISTIQTYFDVSRHDMGDDIFVGDLEKTITLLDGVLSIIKLRIYKIYYGNYSPDICPLPTGSTGTNCVCEIGEGNMFKVADGAIAEEIDLDEVEMVLYGDYNSMYEIKYPSEDIQIKVKLR